jgi:glycine amidinotransferase
MTKIVNSWNEWDPLKRVIVGRPEGTSIPAPEPAWWYDLPRGRYPLGSYGPFPQEMIDAANEQMDYFVGVLERRGVLIDRIEVQPFMFGQPLPSPLGWVQPNAHGVNNVRDVTMIHGNYVVEATTCRRSRIYERFNLRPLFEQYFKEDPELVHFAAPLPMLTNESYVSVSGTGTPDYYYYFDKVWTDEQKAERLHNWEFQLSEKEPLWDAADGMRFGKDIFHQCSSVTNKGGMDWLKRMLGALGIRVHHVLFDTPADPEKPNNHHPWHIDVDLMPLRPGLCMYNPDWPPITQEFRQLFELNDWELVPAAPPTHVHTAEVYLFGDCGKKSWISMNTLSIDPKTVCVEAHESAYCEQLDKLGFEVIPIPYEHVIPLGGALHCTTLDVYREGDCEDYFPRQVPAY